MTWVVICGKKGIDEDGDVSIDMSDDAEGNMRSEVTVDVTCGVEYDMSG